MEIYMSMDRIWPALDHLYKFYPSLRALGRAIGIPGSNISNWRRKDISMVRRSTGDKVLALYKDLRDKEPTPEVLAKSIWTQDQKRLEEVLRPGAVLTSLEIGKSYVVREESDPRYGHVVKGRVLKDLGRFYLLDCGGYKETVSKQTLMTDACKVKKL